MQQIHHLSIVDAIASLQQRGFYYDFIVKGSSLCCLQEKLSFRFNEFAVQEMYYFRRSKKSTVENIAYGIVTNDHFLRGILLVSGKGKESVFSNVVYRKLQEDMRQTWRITDIGLL